ncbi:secreted protein [Candidatus Thiomargarita nelsonii]|uniref:Secreted protein n=1 Tax=Candidatus Thiomargarita nelsonii TaxID=1003181 RepID=A0A176RV95_9GAMM|nr:secreted protein [Candidatus Thiomargarita nelsonii]
MATKSPTKISLQFSVPTNSSHTIKKIRLATIKRRLLFFISIMLYCSNNSTRSVEAGIPTQSVGTRTIRSIPETKVLVPTLRVGMHVATLCVAC